MQVLKRPYTVIGANGERREDPYYWLRDDERKLPDVLEHLKVGIAHRCTLFSSKAVLR